jgi:hypothetical protein
MESWSSTQCFCSIMSIPITWEWFLIADSDIERLEVEVGSVSLSSFLDIDLDIIVFEIEFLLCGSGCFF